MNKRERERRSARRRSRECLRVMNVRKEKYIYIYIYVCVWKKEKKVALLYLIFIVSRYIGLAEKKPIQRFTCNVEARPAISMISVSMAAVPVVSKWRSLSKVLRFLRKFGCAFDDKRLFIRSFGEFCYYPIRNERNLLLWISKNFIRRKDWTIAVSTKGRSRKIDILRDGALVLLYGKKYWSILW